MQNERSYANHPGEMELNEPPGKRRSEERTAHIRQDTNTSAAVNKGLAAALLVNLPAGFKVMSDAGVPTSVIMRVFLKPEQRRASDWKTE